MVDVSPEVYELVRLVVHLVRYLYVAVDYGIPFERNHMISVLASDTVRPNAVHTTTIIPTTFLSCQGDWKKTSASSI